MNRKTFVKTILTGAIGIAGCSVLSAFKNFSPMQNLSAATSILSPATRLGYVQLTVSDLAKQLDFYTRILGLQIHWQEEGKAGLGAGKADLLRLTEDKTAKKYGGTTGLYHQAFLLPSRKELGRAIARIEAYNYPQSPTDHLISQTTYLQDADGNTVELLADTPEEGTWYTTATSFGMVDKNGNARSGRDPLDVQALFKLLTPEDDIYAPFSAETITGHVHLYMNDLEKAMHFYSDVLGFQKDDKMFPFQMGEVNLPNYNVHIIAFNTWKGKNAKQPPAGAVGIQYYTVHLINEQERIGALERIKAAGLQTEPHAEGILVRDPVGIGVVLKV